MSALPPSSSNITKKPNDNALLVTQPSTQKPASPPDPSAIEIRIEASAQQKISELPPPPQPKPIADEGASSPHINSGPIVLGASKETAQHSVSHPPTNISVLKPMDAIGETILHASPQQPSQLIQPPQPKPINGEGTATPHILGPSALHPPGLTPMESIGKALPTQSKSTGGMNNTGTTEPKKESPSAPSLLRASDEQLEKMKGSPPIMIKSPLLQLAKTIKTDEEFAAFLKANYKLVRTNIKPSDEASIIKQARVCFLAEKHANESAAPMSDRQKNALVINALANRLDNNQKLIALAEGGESTKRYEQLEGVSHPSIDMTSWDKLPPTDTFTRFGYLAQITHFVTGYIFAGIKDDKGTPFKVIGVDVFCQLSLGKEYIEELVNRCGLDKAMAAEAIKKFDTHMEKLQTSKPPSLEEVLDDLKIEMGFLLADVSGEINRKIKDMAASSELPRQASLLASVRYGLAEGYSVVALIGGGAHVNPDTAAKTSHDPALVSQIYDYFDQQNIPYAVFEPIQEPSSSLNASSSPELTRTLKGMDDDDDIPVVAFNDFISSSKQQEKQSATATAAATSVPKKLTPKQKYEAVAKEAASLRTKILMFDKAKILEGNSGAAYEINLILMKLLKCEMRLIELKKLLPKDSCTIS